MLDQRVEAESSWVPIAGSRVAPGCPAVARAGARDALEVRRRGRHRVGAGGELPGGAVVVLDQGLLRIANVLVADGPAVGSADAGHGVEAVSYTCGHIGGADDAPRPAV